MKIKIYFLIVSFLAFFVAANAAVVSVGSAEQLTAAFTSSSTASGDIVKLTSNVDLGSVSVGHSKVEKIVLDLNGFSLTYSGENSMFNLSRSSGITLKDSGVTGSIRSAGAVFTGSGTGMIEITAGSITSVREIVAVSKRNDNTVVVSGGVLSVTGAGAPAIKSASSGKVTISGSAVVSSVNAGLASGTILIEGGELEITGGTISNTAAPEGFSVFYLPEISVSISGATVGRTNFEACLGNSYFRYLSSVCNDAVDGSAIKLLNDIPNTSIYLSRPVGLTIDLNGCSLFSIQIKDDASLLLVDTKNTGQLLGDITSFSKGALSLQGVRVLGGLIARQSGDVRLSNTRIEGAGEEIIHSGTGKIIVDEESHLAVPIFLSNAASLSVNGATIACSATNAIHNTGSGTITITDATIASGRVAIECIGKDAGRVTIGGSSVVTTSRYTYPNDAAIRISGRDAISTDVVLVISSGTVSNTSPTKGYSVYSSGGVIEIAEEANVGAVYDKIPVVYTSFEGLYDHRGDGKLGFYSWVQPDLDRLGGLYWINPKNGTTQYLLAPSALPFYYSVPKLVEDVNGDGLLDYGFELYGSSFLTEAVLLSQPDGQYVSKNNTSMVPNLDLTGSGKSDFLFKEMFNDGRLSRFESYRLDGAKAIQRTSIIAKPFEEFHAEFDSDRWTQATQHAYFTGKGQPPVLSTVGVGGDLGMRAPIPVTFPNRAQDLNRDGHIDMLDTRGRIAYLNMGEEGFATQAFNSDIVAKDLTGNGIVDFITFGGTDKKVIAHIYKGNGEVQEQVLLDANIAADPKVYCYDFNKDGFVDILITSSYKNNKMGFFTVIAQNDGTGEFTIKEDYDADGKKKMLHCTDLNHDGYYDIMLLDYSIASSAPKVVVRLGQSDFAFAPAIDLFDITETYGKTYYGDAIIEEINGLVVADVDHDDRPEIMLSTFYGPMGRVYKYTAGNINTAPLKPAPPVVNYNSSTGQVEVVWKHNNDAETSSCDLTYALRIGTEPGLNDVINSHANADGTRRNMVEGNMGYNLSKRYDCSAWTPGTYYVALQVIDPAFKGSPFSEEVSFTHTYMPSAFTLSSSIIAAYDTLTVAYTPLSDPYEYHWEISNATVISDESGRLILKWNEAGEKRIALKIDNSTTGEESEVFARTVTVQPSRLLQSFDSFSSYNISPVGSLIDYDLNGTMDYVSHSNGMGLAGLVDNDGKGVFKKRGAVFNASLKVQSSWWADWTNNGLPDMIFVEEGGNAYQNDGTKILTQTAKGSYSVSDFTPWGQIDRSSRRQYRFIDINNDGRLDLYSHLNNGDGTFTLRNTQLENNYLYSNFGGKDDGFKGGDIIDSNRDGYWDYWTVIEGASSSYNGIRIWENPGNDIDLFTPHDLLFPSDNLVVNDIKVADINNDGYQDVILLRDNRYLSIFYNDQNTRLLPSGNWVLNKQLYFQFSKFSLFDVDNNGYLDVVTNVIDSDDNKVKPYIFYQGELGLISQGFLSKIALPYSPLLSAFVDVTGDGIPDSFIAEGERFWVDENSNSQRSAISYFSEHVTTASNTPPQPPTGVVVQQTPNSLVIEWEPARDNETPYMQMRYNLAVKRKGKSGNGSYIISPMNGGNASAKAIPSNGDRWFYHGATRFEIPIGVLPLEELEVSLQSIDMWDATSPFSETITVAIKESATLEVAPNVCINSPVEVRYTGVKQSTPTWDFDGGVVVEGSDYGPYLVEWNSSGLRTVRVTTAGASSSIQTFVGAEIPATINFPTEVYCGQQIEFALPAISPKNSAFSWSFELPEGYAKNAIKMVATAGRSVGTVTFNDCFVYGEAKIKFTIKVNECSKTIEQKFVIYPPIPLPEIGYVGQAAGKNVIHWDADQLASDVFAVIVYKEGAVFNDFVEIARVSKTDQQFTDASSNTTIKSERYRLAGMMTNGRITPMGKIHKTIHLTINQGIPGQWNLIWNQYDGCPISYYTILRGSSAETLHTIGQLSGSLTSFTDVMPNVDEPYYALTYQPLPYYYSPAAAAQRVARTKAAVEVQSNIVSNQNARTIKLVDKINIMSIQSVVELNSEQRSLYLYAEVLPWNASYPNVAWSIVSGGELADISPFGVLTGKANASGTVRVQAMGTDGSNTITTRDIKIVAFAPECGAAYALNADVGAGVVTLSWAGNADSYNVMWRLKNSANWSSRSVTEKVLTLQLTDFPSEGEYEWLVESRCAGSIIAFENGQPFVYSAVTNVEESLFIPSTLVYPNPTRDVLYIKTTDMPKQVVVLSLQGQVLINASGTASISTASLMPNMFYIVRVVESDGKISHHKILKK